MKRVVLPLIAAVALSSCAEFNGPRDSTSPMINHINISTPAVSGAKCTFKTEDYTYDLTTPGLLQVMPTYRDISYVCSHDGFVTARGLIQAHKPRWDATRLTNKVIPGDRYDLRYKDEWNFPQHVAIDMIPESGVAAAHQDVLEDADTVSRTQLDREFQQMLDETSWVVHGGQPPVMVESNLPPVENVQDVPVVKTAAPNATPQDGDKPQPLNLMQ